MKYNYEPLRFDPPEPLTEREMYSRLEPHGSLVETDAQDKDSGFNWDDYYRYEERGDDE